MSHHSVDHVYKGCPRFVLLLVSVSAATLLVLSSHYSRGMLLRIKKTSRRHLKAKSVGQYFDPKTVALKQQESRFCPPKTNEDINFRPGHPKGRPVQFIHIPKAGGTSIQQSLIGWSEQYTKGVKVFLHDGDGPNWNSPQSRGLFLGHRGYGFTSAVKENNPVTIVVLREPVSRMISHFDYVMNGPFEIFRNAQIAWRGMTFDQVFQEYDDILSKYLAKPSGASIELTKAALVFHNSLQQQKVFLCGYDCMPSAPTSFDDQITKAKENLEKIDCVGVMENLPDLVLQLKTWLDFIPARVTQFQHLNVMRKHKKSRPSDATIQKLKIYLKYEIELYNRAKEISIVKTAHAKACL